MNTRIEPTRGMEVANPYDSIGELVTHQVHPQSQEEFQVAAAIMVYWIRLKMEETIKGEWKIPLWKDTLYYVGSSPCIPSMAVRIYDYEAGKILDEIVFKHPSMRDRYELLRLLQKTYENKHSSRTV